MHGGGGGNTSNGGGVSGPFEHMDLISQSLSSSDSSSHRITS